MDLAVLRAVLTQVVKLLHNFFQKNETDHRLSVGIISPYLGQVATVKRRWKDGGKMT